LPVCVAARLDDHIERIARHGMGAGSRQAPARHDNAAGGASGVWHQPGAQAWLQPSSTVVCAQFEGTASVRQLFPPSMVL
jgi:hypothetical protein